MSAPTAPTREVIDGARLLDEVHAFLGRFVAYPSEAAHVAHTLWVAHSYFMDSWESTPRIAFLSPEPNSGKTRALEVTEPLVPRPVHAVNTTPAYLFRKVSDEAGPPTILYDEIDTVFGPKAKDNEDVRGMLNAGHRRGAVAGRCVTKGKTVVTEELPAYCAVALAGLDDLPDTVRTRSVIIRMRRRKPSERVEPWRHRIHAPQGQQIADRLEDWSKSSADKLVWPEIPNGIEDRNADVWEPLLAVADLAGSEWPKRGRVAAVALVAVAADQKQTLGVQLLTDLHRVFDGASAMHTEVILGKLNALEDAPWGDLRGKELDARSLANRLRPYDVHPTDVRIDDVVRKGYRAEDLSDAWSRYLSAPSAASATSATSATPDTEPVADVADVADKSQGAQTFDDLFLGSCEVGGDIAACLNSNCRGFGFCVVGEHDEAPT
jgi:Protein of unknown function (DUF3631)